MASWRPFFLVWILITAAASAQEYYSYVNKDGVKVFTNTGRRGRLQVQATRRTARRRASATTKRPGPSVLAKRSVRYSDLIRDISARYDEDEELVKAIISVESAFDPRAVSVKNCQGLMQLHPDTAGRFGVENPFDPAQNIEGGVKYLRFLRRNFDDLELVLAAYNAGEGAVRRHDGVPPYKETRNYVKKVLALYEPRQGAATAATGETRRPVYRIEMPDGSILLTNIPRRRVSRSKGNAALLGGG